MNRILILIVCFILAVPGYAQNSPLPKDFVFDIHADMKQYNKYIIPCIDWVQQTPLNVYKKERAQIHDFLLHWLQINPDIDLSMPDYALKFHGIHREYLYLFLEGWIKYSLESNDRGNTSCAIAGLRSMLDYYESGRGVDMGTSEYLDNLGKIDNEGKLKELFDTSRSARNTYLYLKAPYSKHHFRHDENYFNFTFYCINMLTNKGIRYRYMIDGYYDKWIATTNESVTYPRLPPGDYNFRVQATMFNNFDHAVESNYSFTIAKPVWQESWFIALATLSGCLLVFLFVKQREKNLKNIAMLKHERMMFEYEHLKSQVNPHFLFNSLNTLTHLIEKDPKKAIGYTEDLSRLYHHILAHHDQDLILLSEEFAILHNYISIQKGRFGTALQLDISIPPEVMRTKKIVPLALQMLIENAIKHNIVSATEPLIIAISANEDQIIIRNPLHPKLTKEKGKGLGLVNIKRRYGLLTKKAVSYGVSENEYIAILPLL